MSDNMIVWAANIDAERTRNMGRKLAKGLSIKSPDLKELSKAAHNLGLQCTREKDKLFPKDRANFTDAPLDGRLVIAKKYTKTKTLKILADEVRRMRKEGV
ncbi:MAG: signal recognition particle subunit SRP19/SEC65 family protein [Candidatus Methanofastidiosa archaeon]|nr:signal recognition particle subunit SRP19/SEC65 family protein [Candidatus Methanofastidiosa archaeon]